MVFKMLKILVNVQARHEVKENTKGYANLEDKGRKVPVEQNRPEDLM